MPRPLAQLPKAHLHLHFTGSMRHGTLVELAREHGIRLPAALTEDWPPRLSGTDERGWFRFQRLYDTARSSVPLSRGGQSSVSAAGSRMPRSRASSTSVPCRIDPVKCRCRCALGSWASGRDIQ